MPASHQASWCKLSRLAQQQSVLCPASASSQGSKQSSIWGTTCKQLVSRPSQASIMPSRLRSVTGQLAACPSWAECMWPSRCWQLLRGIIPPFRGPQNITELLIQISSQLRSYVASAQQGSRSHAAMALAQGSSQNPAQPLSQAPRPFFCGTELT